VKILPSATRKNKRFSPLKMPSNPPLRGRFLTTSLTHFLDFLPFNHSLTRKNRFGDVKFGQKTAEYISAFWEQKSPENTDFPGFLTCFDIV